MKKLIPHRRKKTEDAPLAGERSSASPSPQPKQRVADEPIPLGLLVLWAPKDFAPLVDIVAVHGLNGHQLKTWTAGNGALWLKDADFLPQELPYARIFSFGYDSKLTYSKSAATIRDFALGLLDELDNARTRPEEQTRPLLFMGHSLGGIVIKQALILALEQQHRFGKILESTKGIIFLGTPHKGAKLADWTKFSRDIIDIAPFGPSVVRTTLLKNLETNSEVLKGISESFQHRALSIKITSFYERVFTAPLKSVVVDQDSALLGYPGEEALPLNTDHSNICKIEQVDSQQWRSISGAVKRKLDGLDLGAKYEEALQQASASHVRAPTELDEQIHQILHPVSFDAELDRRIDFEMCPATCDWISNHKSYLLWRGDRACNIFWAHGSPGCGKSFLTSIVYRRLLREATHARSGVAFFACDRTVGDRSRALPLYHSLFAQLLKQSELNDPEGVKSILADLEASGAVGQINSPYQVWKTLKAVTQLFTSVKIVVDGLDENKDWKDVVALLKRLTKEWPGKVKIFISSRSWDTIRELLTDADHGDAAIVHLDDKVTLQDVNTYVTWRLTDLDARDLGGRQHVVKQIVDGSDGLFLLARHRTETLLRQSREDKADLLQVLKHLPKEVNEYYSQSVQRVLEMSKKDRDMATKIFAWAAFVTAHRPFTFAELANMLSFHETRKAISRHNFVSRSRFDVLCQGMLILQNDTVNVAHGTVLEYLHDTGLQEMTKDYGSEIHKDFDSAKVEAEIGDIFLSYLCACPNPDYPNRTWSQADLRAHPLMEYALSCWPPHAFAAKRLIPPALAKFMQSPQRHHWWQCWTQTADTRGNTSGYTALQNLFHSWVDSFMSPSERQKILDTAGPNLPLRMMLEKFKLVESHEGPERDAQMFHCMSRLSMLYMMDGQWAEALSFGERALSMRPVTDQRSLAVFGNIARLYGMRGDLQKEVETKRQVVDFAKSLYGEHHLQTIIALDNLSLGCRKIGSSSEALEKSLEALTIAKNLLGTDHLETAMVMMNRATLLMNMETIEEALDLAQSAFHTMTTILGTGHHNSIIAQDNIAQILYIKGDAETARTTRLNAFTTALVTLGHEHFTTRAIFSGLEAEFQAKDDFEALAVLREYRMMYFAQHYGEDDYRTMKCMNEMLLAHMQLQHWEDAKTIGERLVSALRPKKDEVDDGLLWRAAIQKLSKVYDSLDDLPNAILYGEDVLTLFIRSNRPEDVFSMSAARDQARRYHRVKDWENAVRCGLLAVEVATVVAGRDSKEVLTYKRELALAYWNAYEHQTAFTLDNECFATCMRIYGPLHADTIESLIYVCEDLTCLAGQKDGVLSFYSRLLEIKMLADSTIGEKNEFSERLNAGLELFKKVPQELHEQMDVIRNDLSQVPANSKS